jgi:hypothetical protein
VREPGRNQEGAEHTHPGDEGNKRKVSKPGRIQQGAEHAHPRDEGNKKEVRDLAGIKREQSTHSLETRGIKGK